MWKLLGSREHQEKLGAKTSTVENFSPSLRAHQSICETRNMVGVFSLRCHACAGLLSWANLVDRCAVGVPRKLWFMPCFPTKVVRFTTSLSPTPVLFEKIWKDVLKRGHFCYLPKYGTALRTFPRLWGNCVLPRFPTIFRAKITDTVTLSCSLHCRTSSPTNHFCHWPFRQIPVLRFNSHQHEVIISANGSWSVEQKRGEHSTYFSSIHTGSQRPV